MKQIYSNEIEQQLNDSLELLKVIFGQDLLGVYLYGSSLVGGLQTYRDINLFVVTNRAITSQEKNRLATQLLLISGLYMKDVKRPIEMTLAQKTALNPCQYPPHVDFQYGEWLRDSFEKGIIELWLDDKMSDLAIIVTHVLLKSQTLWGPEPEQLLAPVPYHDFMHAMLHDINRLVLDLEHDTRNVLLTLARIWSTLATDTIRPKPGADWAMNHLPVAYQSVMQRAKSICTDIHHEYWDDLKPVLKTCADFILANINTQAALVHLNDPNKPIKLEV